MKRPLSQQIALAAGIFALVAAVILLLLWPLICLALGSVNASRPGAPFAFTWGHYLGFFQSRRATDALLNSLGVSLLVALLSVALCLGPAWLFARRSFRGKRLARALFAVPMSFSGILIGFLSVIMLGRIGAVPRFLEWLTGRDLLSGFAYQLGGILLAYFYFEIPRATLTLEAALRKLDPRLELAARSLGATPAQAFRLVTLPQLWPALLSTFALTFCVSLGSFGVVLIVAKRFSLLPLEAFQQVFADTRYGAAAAMSIVLLACALLVGFLARWVTARLTHSEVVTR